MAKTKKTDIRKVVNIYERWSNPLRFLSQPEIERMLEQSRFGIDERLQLAFYEIERKSPIYGICISKRISGVTNRRWDIVPVDDSEQAKLQSENVKKMFKKCEQKNKDGLTDAIRHLALAAFRGRSAIKPFILDNGDLVLKRLQNWNFLLVNETPYWNPNVSAQSYSIDNDTLTIVGDGVKEIPDGEVAWIEDERPIDIPGLQVYLREIIGEENWARAVEKYGIAQIILTAPEGTPDDELEKWDYRSQAIFEGASGCLPNGTNVSQMTDARTQDPFSNYIHHQMDMIAIMSTGSTLATLGGTSGASGTGMGSNLSEIQNEQFKSLISSDCLRISNAISEVVVKKCVESLFGIGSKVLCRFEYVEDDQTTVQEYLEYAKMAKELGLKVDIQELKRLTKLSFISDQEGDLWSPTNDEVEGK